jgi:light-regulated signal transduction histidine kinase (bacteriophytochrome)
MHQTVEHVGSVIISEFELHKDGPTAQFQDRSPLRSCSDTMSGPGPPEHYAQRVQFPKRPLTSRRSGGKTKCTSVAMDAIDTLSRVQGRLATAANVGSLLDVVVETVKELTGFHRVMFYQFAQDSNARVVTEHVDAKATAETYLGRQFTASGFTEEPHTLNKLRMLHDREIGSARLGCKAPKAFQCPLTLTYSYIRVMSSERIEFLAKLAAQPSVSISVMSFNRLWGLIVCHSYGVRRMSLSFPVREICHLLSDMVSGSIERFSYASQLKAKSLVTTLPKPRDLSTCLDSSLAPLLKLLRADCGILSVRNTTQVFGQLD